MKKIVNKIRIKTLEKIAEEGAKIAALVPIEASMRLLRVSMMSRESWMRI